MKGDTNNGGLSVLMDIFQAGRNCSEDEASDDRRQGGSEAFQAMFHFETRLLAELA